jgi:hypothetical protein
LCGYIVIHIILGPRAYFTQNCKSFKYHMAIGMDYSVDIKDYKQNKK